MESTRVVRADGAARMLVAYDPKDDSYTVHVCIRA